MRRPLNLPTVCIFLVSGLLASNPTKAQYFNKDITLTAGRDSLQLPYIHSYTWAELVDNNGIRIYSVQCILGHAVSDITANYDIFTAQIVNSNGYLSSTTRDLATGQDRIVDYNHCYGATMIAHANLYNLHQRQDTESACTGPPPPSVQKPEKYTPVLVDLETDGFHLSGPDPAVSLI